MAWAAVIGAGGAILGGVMANKGNKSAAAAQAEANKGDPRKSAMLYGENGGTGLLKQYQDLGAQPQSAGTKAYGQGQDDYLKANGSQDMQKLRDSASAMAGSNIAAPQAGNSYIGAPAWAVGNMVQAPKQNNMDLSGSYSSLINGQPGANPFLTKSLQGGMDQSKNMFDQMQSSATENLKENILPQIGSNAILSGQYGGSRQGIAEGNAIGDNQKAMQQAANQFGQNNTNAMAGAQLQAYDSDRNRQLSATQGLGAQQYGVAQQDAATKNQAEFMNVNQVADINKTQAGLNQQVNLANQGAQQQTNQLNSVNQLAGLGAQQGLLGQTVNAATNQDNYGLNKAGQMNGLLAPYLGSNPAQQVAPQSNVAGSALGSAGAALGLYNQYKQASSPSANNIDGANYKNNPLFNTSNYAG